MNTNATPPKEVSKGFGRVLKRGCNPPKNLFGDVDLDYDCDHDYRWTCDDCPIVIDKYSKKTTNE